MNTDDSDVTDINGFFALNTYEIDETDSKLIFKIIFILQFIRNHPVQSVLSVFYNLLIAKLNKRSDKASETEAIYYRTEIMDIGFYNISCITFI